MGVKVKYVRPPQGGLSYEVWEDQAACQGLDPKLFELDDRDSIGFADQMDNIAQGLRVCSGCPVRAACKNNSTETERYWTTRGGQPPEGLFQDSKMPPPEMPFRLGGANRSPREPKKYCKRGHDNWKTRNDGKRRCLTCDQAREKLRWGGGK